MTAVLWAVATYRDTSALLTEWGFSADPNLGAANAADFASFALKGQRPVQSHTLREIFGNPFRPVALDPAWQTATVVALTQAIYDEPAFDRLPILADALEDAGCTDADMLNHCRQPGAHVRGCWVVDLLLAKT
jgi:hypothetical protein